MCYHLVQTFPPSLPKPPEMEVLVSQSTLDLHVYIIMFISGRAFPAFLPKPPEVEIFIYQNTLDLLA